MNFDPHKLIEYAQDRIGPWAVTFVLWVALFVGMFWAFDFILTSYISIYEKIKNMDDDLWKSVSRYGFILLIGSSTGFLSAKIFTFWATRWTRKRIKKDVDKSAQRRTDHEN